MCCYSSAICVATFVRGTDEDTCILRRNIVRYIVLTQALVLRDISLQVRKRFPTPSTLVAAGTMSICSLLLIIAWIIH
uniref:Bestrophin homolog n=1 Tax=Parascaris equorum TaxID=6256 RepID=A0A914R7B3_PAREQ